MFAELTEKLGIAHLLIEKYNNFLEANCKDGNVCHCLGRQMYTFLMNHPHSL